MRFQKGDTLVCVVSGGNSLTVGKEYKAHTNQRGNGVVVVNDVGGVGDYKAHRFVLAAEAVLPFDKAPQGTRVYCLSRGEGEITGTGDSERYPVRVCFDSGATNIYTASGRHIDTDITPQLYYSKPEIKAAKRPVFISKLVGTQVLVSYADNKNVFKTGKVTAESEHSVTVDGNPMLRSLYVFHVIGDQV